MKRWVLLLTLFCSPFLFCDSNQPLFFQSQTALSSNAQDLFSFSWTQTIDFECSFKTSSLDSLDLTFTRIRGEGSYQDHEFQLDTDEEDETNYELASLKQILNIPFHICLTPDLSIKKPVPDFAQVLELTPGLGDSLSEDLLDLLLSSILAPSRYDTKKNILSMPLYYPFQSNLTVSPNLALQKFDSEIFFDQDLDVTGPYSIGADLFSLQLSGEVAGEIKWDNNSQFSKYFRLSHSLNEKAVDPLFAKPLQFDYSFCLQQITHD